MKEVTWLLCTVVFCQSLVIVYLLSMLKDLALGHTKTMKSITEDVLLTVKAKDSYELAQSRAFQKEADIVRETLSQSVPFTPAQAEPSKPTYTTKDGKELQILRPRV